MNLTIKTLVVFDFDFTIAKTIEEIFVWSPRGDLITNDRRSYKKIHPTQLQQEGIADDESITEESFCEFYSLDQKHTKIIPAIFPYIKYHTNAQEIFILTARPQEAENEILSFLEINGIDKQKINFVGLRHSSFLKKIEWIESKINKNFYQKLIIFEDNKNLIDYLLNPNNIKDIEKELYYINNFYDKTVITNYER
jgi:hypothetical protein